MRRDTLGKLIGLAGLAGVAATGVVIARDEQERRAYSADDVRTRLHERAASAVEAPAPAPEPEARENPLQALQRRLHRRSVRGGGPVVHQ